MYGLSTHLPDLFFFEGFLVAFFLAAIFLTATFEAGAVTVTLQPHAPAPCAQMPSTEAGHEHGKPAAHGPPGPHSHTLAEPPPQPQADVPVLPQPPDEHAADAVPAAAPIRTALSRIECSLIMFILYCPYTLLGPPRVVKVVEWYTI